MSIFNKKLLVGLLAAAFLADAAAPALAQPWGPPPPPYGLASPAAAGTRLGPAAASLAPRLLGRAAPCPRRHAVGSALADP